MRFYDVENNELNWFDKFPLEHQKDLRGRFRRKTTRIMEVRFLNCFCTNYSLDWDFH